MSKRILANGEALNEQLRADVDKFREENFDIAWSKIAELTGINLPYVYHWKARRADFGTETYDKLRTFIDDNTK